MSTTETTFFPVAHRDRIISHMNEDHADAVLGYVRHFGGIADATAARLDDLDQAGMSITISLPGGEQTVRIAYPKPLDTPADAHPVLVEMAMTAASATPAVPPAPRRVDALERAREAAANFRTSFQTVILGTVSADGIPDASVSAAVMDESGAFLIYVSALSLHTRNIAATGRASVFFIEDESVSRNLLARKRLTFPCKSEAVDRDSVAFANGMAALKTKFGPVMEHLEGMTDFRMFRLTPSTGRLVVGFGQAYDVAPDDWTKLSHVGETGHSPAHAAHKA